MQSESNEVKFLSKVLPNVHDIFGRCNKVVVGDQGGSCQITATILINFGFWTNSL